MNWEAMLPVFKKGLKYILIAILAFVALCVYICLNDWLTPDLDGKTPPLEFTQPVAVYDCSARLMTDSFGTTRWYVRIIAVYVTGQKVNKLYGVYEPKDRKKAVNACNSFLKKVEKKK